MHWRSGDRAHSDCFCFVFEYPLQFVVFTLVIYNRTLALAKYNIETKNKKGETADFVIERGVGFRQAEFDRQKRVADISKKKWREKECLGTVKRFYGHVITRQRSVASPAAMSSILLLVLCLVFCYVYGANFLVQPLPFNEPTRITVAKGQPNTFSIQFQNSSEDIFFIIQSAVTSGACTANVSLVNPVGNITFIIWR